MILKGLAFHKAFLAVAEKEHPFCFNCGKVAFRYCHGQGFLRVLDEK